MDALRLSEIAFARLLINHVDNDVPHGRSSPGEKNGVVGAGRQQARLIV
jgi:hypothetical protein